MGLVLPQLLSRLRNFSLRAATLAVVQICPPAFAAPGDLDTTFGGFGVDGKISGVGFTVRAMTLDAAGRLILAGEQNGEFHVQR